MIALAVLAAGTGFYISLKQSQQELKNPGIEGLFWPSPKQIQPFEMVDQAGHSFALEDIKSKWSFIFFGYTHCPDICPVTMSVMAETYQRLITEYKDLQIIFVTVDPERDTTEKLATYVSYFNEDFIGLGGNTDQVNSLTRQIGIAYYLNKQEAADNYLVDHSASVFLIDPKARMVGKLSPPHETEKIINQFKTIRTFINAQ